MSLHKLTAGSGYDYLTRQVAVADATDKGHVGLADYYTATGETPGVWVGAGLAGLAGLSVGDTVTAEQMGDLFGAGRHPLAGQRTRDLDLAAAQPDQPTPTQADYRAAVRLGAPFKVYEPDVSAFRVAVAARLDQVNTDAGLPGDWPVPADQRARVRTEVAVEFFRAEHHRDPADAREIAATIARHSRPQTTAVAGFDLTFSPVKSVSVLWALADPATAARIECAHQAAVTDALAFLEKTALFTRRGANGIRQVNVRGLVAAAFTHRDSRAGDPDLHTHVAVANKVQTLDGDWLAIDGRLLFKAKVAASETYNTALETHLSAALGVRFAPRADTDPRKRPIREITDVDPALSARFSQRRAAVTTRRDQLATAFHATHGRPPTPVETLALAQQATVETRQAKHEPRSLAQQRAAWRAEAITVLGTERRLEQMVRTALHPTPDRPPPVDAGWVTQTAADIVTTLQTGRATWQYWHAYAEAHRRVRGTATAPDQVPHLVSLLVTEALDRHSVAITRPVDTLAEPAPLRRRDGASAYTIAGGDLFTSPAVLAAETRLVAAAGRRDGARVDQSAVDLALLEAAANGAPLNAGQAALVTGMATSGARVQLAIAPAGSGKTTAMRALAAAWTNAGGTVVGLAPSAAAAEGLRTQIDATTDTLAKLTHALDHARHHNTALPDWITRIGPQTLVVIDEAGMADTLTLDTAINWLANRGASVRLIGDDQQLAAIGAGGVLRDIRATHGALHLTELVRFTDPAEAAATLALRQGRPEALGFYLDHHRVHVGDLATLTEAVFTAWQHDHAAGRDALMLAPTRDLVADLNHRAQAHRLTQLDPTHPARTGPPRRLADGNRAVLGDLVITRANDRRLRISATDWVKNGDRWHIRAVHNNGDLTLVHTRHHRSLRVPAGYVTAAVELGYATTTHTAQGVTAETTHGLASGTESRQQLYTMLTRGRAANHLYLHLAGDGDPHNVIHPSWTHPPTATDILTTIVGRDDAQPSATSLIRDQTDPAHRLGHAAQRYLDALHVAAEHHLRHHTTGNGLDPVSELDTHAETLHPGLRTAPAWPTLRARLLLLAAADPGASPLQLLRGVADLGDLSTAVDPAAVLDSRLPRPTAAGPLPWLPGIPAPLATDHQWGTYLTARAELVTALTDQVHTRALHDTPLPAWATTGFRPDPDTIADIEVWRAAMQIPATDPRPTGPPQPPGAAGRWQRRLDRRLHADHTPALTEWAHLIDHLAPQTRRDDFTVVLAHRLAAISRAGLPAHQLLRTAAAAGPLPDDHPAAALWWRMTRHLTPAVATHATHDAAPITGGWATRLPDLVGTDHAARLQASPWWPALVTTIDHALARGWPLHTLLATPTGPVAANLDACQALLWRTSVALAPIPDENPEPDHPDTQPPNDLTHGIHPDRALDPHVPLEPPHSTAPPGPEDGHVEGELAVAAYLRDLGPRRLDPTDADLRRAYQRAELWDHAPATRDRMLAINLAALEFFESHYPSSWCRGYLTGRLGADLTGHEHYRPGHAPAGWTTLVDHLRGLGVSDAEMIATGLATTTRTGRTIDRFRDRLVLPLIQGGEILGFLARRNPAADHQPTAGPKYLNTPDTPLFHKGAQLYGTDHAPHDPHALPVLVEGPLDAIAVTLTGAGRYLGLAPLGTALTDEQAAQLADLCRQGGHQPVIATDPDSAGQVAAARHFWMLTPHGLDPTHARLPDGMDPADLLTHAGPAALAAALTNTPALGDTLLTQALTGRPGDQALEAALRILAARPSHAWTPGCDQVRDRFDVAEPEIRTALLAAVHQWDTDPRAVARTALTPRTAAPASSEHRWEDLAQALDPRLTQQPDWPATAALLQHLHATHPDPDALARALAAGPPLGPRPATELRRRLASQLQLDPEGLGAADPPRTVNPSRREARQPSAPRRGARPPRPDPRR